VDLALRLAELARGLANRRHIPHAVLAVESGGGRFRWTGAFGIATPCRTPMAVDTPYFLASIDKMLTAAAVLRLCESGRVALDTPLTACLPANLTRGLHRMDGIDYTDRITVRHLLGHTSGLADYIEDRPRGGRTLVERLVEEGDFSWTREEALDTVRNRMRPHFPPPPADAPRPRPRYCDTNYLLLNALIEETAGQALHAVYGEMIFRPLGLRRTWLPGHSAPADPAPEPASLWFRDRAVALPLAHRSMHSVFSTAEESIRILRALVTGGLFLRPETFSLMRNPWRRFGFPRDAAALRAPSWPIEYGLGLMRFRIPRLFTPFRPLPAVIGHTGSTGSWLFYCEDLDLYLAGNVSQATAGPVPFRFVPKVLRAVGERFPGRES
jgi:D-alanyl-D-alanine carboxypeptidase